jgi:hypothetical protein
VVPIKSQFEQSCNYLALKELGVNRSEDLKVGKLKSWLYSNDIVDISFKDETDLLIEMVLNT